MVSVRHGGTSHVLDFRSSGGLDLLAELLVGHRALVGRTHEAAQQLLAVEALAAAVALVDRDRRRLGALVRVEAPAAALALQDLIGV